MSDVDFLLTDEYVDYTQQIVKLHATKKTREEEMKRVFEEFKEEMGNLESEAKDIHSRWESWKAQQNGQEDETAVEE